MKENHFQLGDNEYLLFQKFISKYSGLHFPKNRRGELEKGLMEALKNAPDGITTVEGYYAYLNRCGDPDAMIELDRLINILTIGETHFFRNTAQFEALANYILPEMIAKKREVANQLSQNFPGTPQLRIWSAGCSTGEEPYSVAMLLRELIPDIEKWRILILGTDINANSLARARQGVYRDWSFREDKARAKRSLYFDKIGNQYQLKEAIRRQVTFAHHNLIEDDFPSTANGIVSMDLILCRNVTIYFSQEITGPLIRKFYDTLVDDGWLLVGHSEPSITAYQEFQIRSYPKAILYQKSSIPSTGYLNGVNGSGSRYQDGRSHTVPATAKLIDPRRRVPPRPQAGLPPTQPLSSTTRKKTTAMLREANIEKEQQAAIRFEEAQLLLVQGKIDKATQLLEALVADNEKHTAAYCLLARTYADQGQGLQARSWSLRAIKSDSLNPTPYYLLALLDENDGFLGQAIENIKKMIYIEANNPLPHFHIALLYKKAGQHELSQRALGNAIKLLENLPGDQILPESGDSAGWLLYQAKEMLREK